MLIQKFWSFEESWKPLGNENEGTKKFAVDLRTTFDITATIESDFSILKHEPDKTVLQTFL